MQARTSVSAAEMTQIDLPDSWVRGLIEAQSAMLMGSHVLLLRADFVADLLAVVESRRETHGPRSLKFILEPGRSVRVVVEPWGLELTDQGSTYLGDEGTTVRVWGRRRLLSLTPLLPYATGVRVDLVGDGMPSYWTVEIDGVRTTIGITGWTRNDWTSKSRFSGLMQAVSIDNDLLRDTSRLLKDHGKLTADRLADLLAIHRRTALSPVRLVCSRRGHVPVADRRIPASAVVGRPATGHRHEALRGSRTCRCIDLYPCGRSQPFGRSPIGGGLLVEPRR